MTVRKWAPASRVNTTTLNDQYDPSMAVLSDGGYIVVWQSLGLIRGQRYDSSGARVGVEFLVANDSNAFDPSVTALADGGFVVSYSNPFNGDLNDIDIVSARYGSNGSLAAVLGISTDANSQRQSEVTGNGSGFAAVYTDLNSTSGDIVLRRFDAAGTQLNSVPVNTAAAAGPQKLADIAELTGGNLAVVWSNISYEVRLAVFSSTGGTITGEIVATTTPVNTTGFPQITALVNGGFVVVWETVGGGSPDIGVDARARIFSSNGTGLGADFLLSTTSIGSRSTPQVASLADGGFVAVWIHDGDTVRGQVFEANGTRNGVEFIVDNATLPYPDDGSFLSVAGLADGRFVVSWDDNDGSGSGVWSQIFDPRDGVVNGNSGANLLYGNDGLNDEISGYKGADTLDGMGGADTLYGGLGGDTYIVGAGDRIIERALGETDLVRASVSFTLGDNLENLTLTGSANLNGIGNGLVNIIAGNGAKNILSGLGGNDTVTGGGGDDVLIGGIGRDGMTGGTGKDRFDFNLVTETGKTSSTRDIIKDFAHAADRIDLSTIDANGSTSGNGSFKFVSAEGAGFTGVRGQLIWDRQDNANNALDRTIVLGDINGDRVADFAIELTGLKALTAIDFVL